MPIVKKKPINKETEEAKKRELEELDLEEDQEVIDESSDEEVEDEDIEDDIDETSDEEPEEEIEEEDEEEPEEEVKPVVKKTVRKKPVKKEPEEEIEEEDEEEEVKPVKSSKKVSTKRSTKPTVDDEEETSKSSDNDDHIVKFIKSVLDDNKYEADLTNGSATRGDFAKLLIVEIANRLNNDVNGEVGTRLKSLINTDAVSIASMTEIIDAVETVFMQLIMKQTTFSWGYKMSPDGTPTRISILRRPIEGRAFNPSRADGAYYVPSYSAMKIAYDIDKKIYHGEYNPKTGIFTDEDGKKHNIAKENEKFVEEDKKKFPRNYPSHLSRK